MSTKTCAGCGEAKPLDDYYADKRKRDGKRGRCKPCVLAQNAGYLTRPENRARRSEYERKWYTENREQKLEYTRSWYAENKTWRNEQIRSYHAKNPHINWAGGARKRAAERGYSIIVEPFTKDDVIERYGDKCYWCGGPFDELDHQPPIRSGRAKHTLEFVRPSCAKCNRGTSWREDFNQQGGPNGC